MTNSKVNQDELGKLLDGISGGTSIDPGHVIVGPLDGVGKSGPRILFVDDLSDVISTFMQLEKDYAQNTPSLPCQITFFRLCDDNGATKEHFLEWLSDQAKFDVIFLDGDLGSQGDGLSLAQEISLLETMAYQPIAIITANASFFKDRAISHGRSKFRILGKFDDTSHKAIQNLVISVRDVVAHTRERFWIDTKSEMARALDEGAEVIVVAETLGKRLKDFYGVTGWYLREMRGTSLKAIAMDDEFYQASESLSLEKTPDFLRKLARAETNDPWVVIEKLMADQLGGRDDMLGHRAMAARVGSKVVGDVTAVVTAYRNQDGEPFVESDAIQLHHMAVLLRLALSPDRTNARLRSLSSAIERVLNADTTALIAARLCDFLQEQINQPFENNDILTKTTTRMFERGIGNLSRWGQDMREIQGSLENLNNHRIPISENCVYTRAVISGEVRWSGAQNEIGEPFIKTADREISSYITVPLVHDTAILGAINLEASGENVYSEKDIALVQAVASVAAAAVFDHRDQRFTSALADLTAKAIDPISGEPVKAEDLLDMGAAILYELTGFAEMILFEADKEEPTRPWLAAKGWSGEDQNPVPIDRSALEKLDRYVSEVWDTTYLKKCLDDDDQVSGVYRGSEGVKDVGPQALGKEEWRETRSHIVMLLGNKGSHHRAVMLLFEHPHPLPSRYDTILASFAHFLETVYNISFYNSPTFGEDFAKITTEAHAARALSHARHSISSQIVSMAMEIKMGLAIGKNSKEILNDIYLQLGQAEKEFETAAMILRLPEAKIIDLGKVWSEVVKDQAVNIEAKNVSVQTEVSSMLVSADPQFVKFILFHLLDNALTHGVKNEAANITVRLEDSAIAICDDGKPFSSHKEKRLFDLGFSTGPAGGGHGLHIAKTSATQLGGSLKFERANDLNTFTLTLESVSDD